MEIHVTGLKLQQVLKADFIQDKHFQTGCAFREIFLRYLNFIILEP